MSAVVSRIVVIDPGVGLPSMLAVLLERYCTVEWAPAATTALQSIGGTTPHLVILDLSVSGLDEVKLADTLRARHPSCRLLVVSAPDDASRLQRVAAVGLDGVSRRGSEYGALVSRVVALLGIEVKWPAAGEPFSPYVSRALEYVSASYQRTLTLDGVARAARVSPSHLAHLFPRFTDLTLGRYLAKVRVDIARRLLIASDAGLDEIAERCGFCDAPHLSRVFRRQTGSRPGAYRRSACAVVAPRTP